MSKIALTLGATTVIGVIVSAHLWQQLSATNGQVRELQGQLVAVNPGQPGRALPAIAGQGGSYTADATAPVAPGAFAPTAAQSGPDGATAAGGQVFSGSSTEMLRDPAARRSMATSIRASLPQRYPSLGEELNLTAEQLGKLYDQLVDNQLELLETTPRANADPAAINEATSKRQALARAHEASLRERLGPTAHDQWKDYNETLDLRQQIGRLHTTLETSAQPLSESQRRQLTTALVAYHKQLKQQAPQVAQPVAAVSDAEKTALVMERVRIARENNQKLRDMAASYLTPEQLDAFGRMQNQESDLTLAMLRSHPGQQQR